METVEHQAPRKGGGETPAALRVGKAIYRGPGDDESLVVEPDENLVTLEGEPSGPSPTVTSARSRRMTRRELVQRKKEFTEQSKGRSRSGGRSSVTPASLTKSTRLAMFLLVSVQLLLGPSGTAPRGGGWGAVNAQTVGVDICACQPSTYTFVLNFGLACENKTIVGGSPGINASDCKITTDRNLNVTDKIPIVVSKVQVLELNRDLDILATTQYDEELTNGDNFNFTSVIASNNITRAEDVPRAMQMTIYGRNQEEEDLVNFWIVIFDNSCGIFPVVLEGQQIGWTIFYGLSNPPVDLCPLAQTPTEAPVETLFPTSRPSLRPNSPPVSEPPVTEPPEPVPSCAPIDRPTHNSSKKKSKHHSSKGGSSKGGSSKGKGKGGGSSKRSSKIHHKSSSKMSHKGSAKYKSSAKSSKSSSGKGGKGSSSKSKSSGSKGKGKGSSSKSKSLASKSAKKKEAYYGSMKKVTTHHTMLSRLLSSDGDTVSLFKAHSPSTLTPVACPEVPTPVMKKTHPPVSSSKSSKGKGKGAGSSKSSSKKISAPPKSGKGSKTKSSSKSSGGSGGGKGSGGKGGGGSTEGKGSYGKGGYGKGSGGSTGEYEGDDADELMDDKPPSSSKEVNPPAPAPTASSAITFPPNPPSPPKQETTGDSFLDSFITGGGVSKDAKYEPPPPGNVFHKGP